MKKTLLQIVLVILSVGLLAEVYLRATGNYAKYSESNGGKYISEYGQTYPTWHHTHRAHDTFMHTSADFSYKYTTNKHGIRDGGHDTLNTKAAMRLMVFGDSFTEGVGAPYDSTWPQLMKKHLKRHAIDNIEIISGAVAGSDPFFHYVMYRDILSIYKPDAIIVSINISDYTDILMRGGMERFNSNGTTKYNTGPWYEPIYAKSRLLRAILHKLAGFQNTGIFTSYQGYVAKLPELNKDILNVLNQHQQLAANNNTAFIVVIHAIPNEIIYSDQAITRLNTEALRQLSALLKSKGIPTIDIHSTLMEQLAKLPQADYTYTNDLHYNGYGYNVMAACIADSLLYNVFYTR